MFFGIENPPLARRQGGRRLWRLSVERRFSDLMDAPRVLAVAAQALDFACADGGHASSIVVAGTRLNAQCSLPSRDRCVSQLLPLRQHPRVNNIAKPFVTTPRRRIICPPSPTPTIPPNQPWLEIFQPIANVSARSILRTVIISPSASVLFPRSFVLSA